MNGAVVVAGITVGSALTFSTVFLSMRVLAWVVTHGLPSMLRLRGQAVVEWQDCDTKDGTDEWPWADDAILLTHEALPDVDECGTPEWWQQREAECADLRDLAGRLGERAA